MGVVSAVVVDCLYILCPNTGSEAKCRDLQPSDNITNKVRCGGDATEEQEQGIQIKVTIQETLWVVTQEKEREES